MSGRVRSSSDVDRAIDLSLLRLAIDLYPERLTTAELISRAETADPQMKDESEAIARALRRLRRADLVCETYGRIVPTRAALHFDRLPL